MNKFLLIILLLIIQIFQTRIWIQCKSFADYYHFSFYDLELQLIYAINHDSGLPVFVARAFHNKVLQGGIDIYKRYTHFLDWQLLITLLSFVGVFGILLSIWSFLNNQKKDKKIGFLILAAFLFPFIEVVINPNLPFAFKLFVIVFPFTLLSILGHYFFIKKYNFKKIIIVYFILSFLSIAWLLLLPEQ